MLAALLPVDLRHLATEFLIGDVGAAHDDVSGFHHALGVLPAQEAGRKQGASLSTQLVTLAPPLAQTSGSPTVRLTHPLPIGTDPSGGPPRRARWPGPRSWCQ